MRGKLGQCRCCIADAGITPADAGKTFCHHKAEDCGWDHPRGCGENMQGSCDDAFGKGSPPRMRGKPAPATEKQKNMRITPADAGKTLQAADLAENPEDHPRGCGENPNDEPVPLHTAGSPPRMRGKRVWGYRTTFPSRITPADAGKTQYSNRQRGKVTDHPRGCGENKPQGAVFKKRRGSPPRMRGKH